MSCVVRICMRDGKSAGICSYPMFIKLRSIVFFLLVLAIVVKANPFYETERYNLKLLSASPMLFEFHRLTALNGYQKFIYPQRDSSWIRNTSARKYDNSLLGYSSNRAYLAASIVGGLDFRGGETLNDTIWPGVDGGLYLRGFVDSLEFILDARIYVEGHSAKYPQSYDGEYMDYQSAENNEGLEYLSYARYRGHMALNMGFTRLDFGRDVMHWGPGFYNNLTLNQFSLPFNFASLEIDVGPLTVMSVLGDLRIYKGNVTEKNKEARNLYGHRYELNLGNLVLGVSELQVVYDDSNPWLCVPFVPLFMEKGNFTESGNNGSLSLDLNYRFFNMGRIYTEFFLDDMQSPISLIENDNVQAKWAWMIGAQIARDFTVKKHVFETGAIVEFARVEPYVYTHFKQNTAQFAHLEVPLGNQGGPNSMTIDWILYSRTNSMWFAGLHQKWFWKGSDYGSALNDTTPRNHVHIKKNFLKGAQMQYSITPMIAIEGKYSFFALEWTFFDDKKVYTRLGFKW